MRLTETLLHTPRFSPHAWNSPTSHGVFVQPALVLALLLCISREQSEGGVKDDTTPSFVAYSITEDEATARMSVVQIDELKAKGDAALELASRFVSTFK